MAKRDASTETRTNSYASAQTTAWSAEVAAANTRRTNEANALAAYRSADYAQQAVAITVIDAALNLPWSVHQELLAAAKSAWWTTSEQASFLALAAAQNSADTTYQNTVNAAFALWTTTTAQAEKGFRVADAGAAFAQSAARYAADEGYEQAMALADEAWQVTTATAVSAREVALRTLNRDAAVYAGDPQWQNPGVEPIYDAWTTAERGIASTYTVAETAGFGARRTAVSDARQTYVDTFSSSWVSYVTATASADEAYAGAEATAAYGRVWTVATEQASRTAASASALAGAINALASTTGTPWAKYDNAVAAADSVFASLVAPAQRDQILSEADAEADFTVAQAAALRALRITQAEQTALRDNSQADSEHDLALGAVTAENFGAPHFAMITAQAAQTATETGKFQGAPARAWDEPAAPATSPAGPAPSLPRTPFLPAPVTPTARSQILPISTVTTPYAQDDGRTTRLPLPGAVAGDVHLDGFFDRSRLPSYDPVRSSTPLAAQPDTDAIPGMGKLSEVFFTPTLLEHQEDESFIVIIVINESEGNSSDSHPNNVPLEKAAYDYVMQGKAGPMTSAQRLEYERRLAELKEVAAVHDLLVTPQLVKPDVEAPSQPEFDFQRHKVWTEQELEEIIFDEGIAAFEALSAGFGGDEGMAGMARTLRVFRNSVGEPFGRRAWMAFGVRIGDEVGVTNVSDAFSPHDAVDAHEQSVLERLGQGVLGVVQLFSTATTIKGAVVRTPKISLPHPTQSIGPGIERSAIRNVDEVVTRYGGAEQREFLLQAVRQARSRSEAKGVVNAFRQMKGLGYDLENALLHYRGNQGVDLIFSKGNVYAVVEAKAGGSLNLLKTYSGGLRQGSSGYNASRLQRYLDYGDGTHDSLANHLLNEAAAGRLESFAVFYRSGKIYILLFNWPTVPAIPR